MAGDEVHDTSTVGYEPRSGDVRSERAAKSTVLTRFGCSDKKDS
jgi:hypothetical protein